uniref:Putative dehydratase n=1 Tax=Arthrobacter globiformis TaxID=1665 RepID=B8R4L2_ARTGO|nr:putative dehydratase [Arthrobacter globiformis]
MSTERYFEDFAMGQVIAHRRGHTVTEVDNAWLSLLSMNTAQTHFNRDSLADYFDGSFRELPLSAPVALAIAIGLSSEDMSEHALAEVGCTAIRTQSPIVAGDTLMVTSEVIALADGPDDGSGRLTYRLSATVRGTQVLSAERTVLLKRRSAHEARDRAHAAEDAAAILRLLTPPPSA